MRTFLANVPLFVPVLGLGLFAALKLGGSLGRRWGVRPAFATLLAASVALILAATLTPGREALLGAAGGVMGRCDLGRVGFASLAQLTSSSDVLLNVLLFVPLGLAIVAVGRHDLRRLVALAGAGLALPVVIELTQSFVPVLGRNCQSADVFDNAMGLMVGLLAGAWLALVARGSHPAST